MLDERYYPTAKTCAESDATPTILFGRREREYRPRGVDPREDMALLNEAIAASANLFNVNGVLMYVNDDNSTLERITKFTLPEIVRKHVVIKRLVNHGSEDAPIWKCEYFTDGTHEWGNNCNCHASTGDVTRHIYEGHE